MLHSGNFLPWSNRLEARYARVVSLHPAKTRGYAGAYSQPHRLDVDGLPRGSLSSPRPLSLSFSLSRARNLNAGIYIRENESTRLEEAGGIFLMELLPEILHRSRRSPCSIFINSSLVGCYLLGQPSINHLRVVLIF